MNWTDKKNRDEKKQKKGSFAEKNHGIGIPQKIVFYAARSKFLSINRGWCDMECGPVMLPASSDIILPNYPTLGPVGKKTPKDPGIG